MAEPNQHNQGNQQNRHPQNTNQQTTQPDPSKEEAKQYPKVSFDREVQKDFYDQIVTVKTYPTFKQVLSELISWVVEGHITPQKSKEYLRGWFVSMSDEEKEVFRTDRQKAEETIRYFQGVVETLAQEVPYLISVL